MLQRRATAPDSRPVTFTPQSTAVEYTKVVAHHALQSSSTTLYSGEIYEALSRFLDPRSSPSKQSLAEPKAFAWLASPGQSDELAGGLLSERSPSSEAARSPGNFERFAAPEDCIQALRRNIEASQPQVLFLRGNPSAEWVSNIGAFCSVDPELFRWFLRYRQEQGDDYYFDLAPPLMSNIFRFRFYTVGWRNLRQPWQQDEVDALRADGNAGFQRYQKELIGGCTLKTGSSIVRNFHVLDQRHCVIEQEMNVSIFEIGKTWMAIACTDAGHDLTEGPQLPWLDNRDSLPTMLLPIIQYRPKCALRSRRLNESQPGPEAVRNAQTLAVFPEGYGRCLDWSVAKYNRFHVLDEIFRLAAFSQKQLLNVMQTKVKAETDRFSHSKEAPTLNNLLYFRDVLQDQIVAAEEMVRLTEQSYIPHHYAHRSTSALSARQRAAADQAVDEVHSLFAALRLQARGLHEQCTQEMTLISNKSMLIESQRAMLQAKLVTKLTIVAFVYIPFSFTAGFFGMNFHELGNGSMSLWVYFAASFPLVMLTAAFFALDGGAARTERP